MNNSAILKRPGVRFGPMALILSVARCLSSTSCCCHFPCRQHYRSVLETCFESSSRAMTYKRFGLIPMLSGLSKVGVGNK